MAKYSFEFKLAIVQEYLEGKCGLGYLAKNHGVSSKKQVHGWINAYREFGEDGLLRKRKKQSYSFQFKIDAIELYQTSELSYRIYDIIIINKTNSCRRVSVLTI